MSDPNQPSPKLPWLPTLATLSTLVALVLALSDIGLNWRALTRPEKRPIITIENQLALPIIVTVNDSAAYKKRLEPNARVDIQLFSASEFPASVHWEVLRHRDGSGHPMGELLSGDYRNVDPETSLGITNAIGVDYYFYPIIHNNTDHLCEIVLNEGLSIEYRIGASNPHRLTNMTGYYKLAQNSNITMHCPHLTYWEGERNGQRGRNGLNLEPGSGIVNFYIQ